MYCIKYDKNIAIKNAGYKPAFYPISLQLPVQILGIKDVVESVWI